MELAYLNAGMDCKGSQNSALAIASQNLISSVLDLYLVTICNCISILAETDQSQPHVITLRMIYLVHVELIPPRITVSEYAGREICVDPG